jgi:hypothetical protein
MARGTCKAFSRVARGKGHLTFLSGLLPAAAFFLLAMPALLKVQDIHKCFETKTLNVSRIAPVLGSARSGSRTAYQHDILKKTVVLCGSYAVALG